MTAPSKMKEVNPTARRQRKRTTREKATPESPAVIIECPPELSPAARQEWDRIIGDLTATGVLKIFDRAALAAYCEAYALWIEAVENMRKYGTVMKSQSGYPVQSPYLSIAVRQVDTMLRIATEFGFTPASRGQRSMIAKADSGLLENDDPDRALGSELKELGDLPELPKLKW